MQVKSQWPPDILWSRVHSNFHNSVEAQQFFKAYFVLDIKQYAEHPI